MAVDGELSTADVAKGRFSAHGLVTVKVDGSIAHFEATGPFNEELLAAAAVIQERVVLELVAKGRWGSLSIFHESAMSSPATLARYAKVLKIMVDRSLSPCATAFVLGADVEGAGLMGPLFAKCHSDLGLLFCVFSQVDEARAWIESTMELANRADPAR